jgi:predicted NUDIX family NTP pyrophosphohydrolase
LTAPGARREPPPVARRLVSAGLLLWRRRAGAIEALLVHPGGPFHGSKDLGAWSIPKGLVGEGEDAVDAARRELREETGLSAPEALVPLGETRLPSGKTVVAWAIEGDCDPSACRSTTFSLEWPPRSGRIQEFPEVDCAAFFDLAEARRRIAPAQAVFLDRLAALVA